MTGEPFPDPAPGFLRPYFRAGIAGDARPPASAPVGKLRPFLLTEGRVAASIPIEAQVVSTGLGRASAPEMRAEHRDIVELCSDPLSVAEVAAHLSLHVGVVRVLVEDLSRNGHLRAYLPQTDTATDEQVLLRLIDGLRALQ